MNFSRADVGAMQVVCKYCEAKRWRNESPSMCCALGKVCLPPFLSPPQPLLHLLADFDIEARQFRAHIRKYNSCFQMTSFGADRRIFEHGFMPTFKIQEQVYHRIGPLAPQAGTEPSLLQIYFMEDQAQQAERRLHSQSSPSNIMRPTLFSIQQMLHEYNPYISLFKTALEQDVPQDHKIFIRADKTPAGEHPRRFNAPTAPEVAALIVQGTEGNFRDIVLNQRDTGLQRVSETHRLYDSLQYSLLFPRDEDGYYLHIWQVNPATQEGNLEKRISPLQYYSYRAMCRENDFNILHRAGKLSQQFFVDMYAKIESERLSYLRMNQTILRADDYIHLRDALRNERSPDSVGQRIIFPSTFTGSPRYMHERLLDAMTYVKHYRRPDLFITMTCNPKWTEIQRELLPNQKPQDRQDLIARVFHLLVQKLMKLIQQKKIFGPCRCHVYSVEWQKRGLPHVHLLVWLEEKIRPRDIDSVVSAELPDPDTDPELFELVKKHIIHGPCGPMNRKSPCMQNNKCTKSFPKPFTQQTITSAEGYPQYRRRAPEIGGIETELNNRMPIDNRWVIPYNAFLLRTFGCHINVEICSSVLSVKYILKYINKGQDMAIFGVRDQDANDEINCFQAARYISTNEALWRDFSFPIHSHHPTVQQLTVHLENGQRVYFTTANAESRAQEPPATTLTQFFQLCATDPFAQTFLYNEAPKYYRWTKKRWKPRKGGKGVRNFPSIKESSTIGRVYTVHPNNVECYHLRLLLHTVRGPKSFQVIKKLDEHQCSTFKEACRRRGLLESDDHWNNTLTEATISQMPRQIRDMFAIMLHMCAISDPLTLWQNHKEAMSEDYSHQRRRHANNVDLPYDHIIFNRTLMYLQNKILSFPSGQPLSQHGLPFPDADQNPDDLPREVEAEYAYNMDELETTIADRTPSLTNDEQSAYERIIRMTHDAAGHLIFLDAPGGTGKIYLLNLILAKIQADRNIAIAVVSTGIAAATLLAGGKTAHSTFKLPLNLGHSEKPTCGISKSTAKGELLRRAQLIVWDECTMSHKKAFEALNTTLQDLRDNDDLMGGLTVILAGDFRQTLPIIERGTKADEINACIKSSRILWPRVETLHLRTNMRVHRFHDASAGAHAELLLRISNGQIPIDPTNSLITIPCGHQVQALEQLEDNVFPSLSQNFSNVVWLSERAILAPTNESVQIINNNLLQKLLTNEKTYISIDTTIEPDDAVNHPTEFLNSLNPTGLPTHLLSLKIGCPIMLLRNLDPPKLCNGTKLIVRQLCSHLIEATIAIGQYNLIEATIAIGQYKGDHVFIPRIPLIPSDTTIPFKRLQFPIKPCFAMTINKSQGQTLATVGLFLATKCFSHGQFYVACSRVSTPDNIYILSETNQTANIVYTEILS